MSFAYHSRSTVWQKVCELITELQKSNNRTCSEPRKKVMVTKNRTAKNGIRPLAIVTGVSSGIGFHLAKQCAENGFDLLIAADDPAINNAAQDFREIGASVEVVETDLATTMSVDQLFAAVRSRPVAALLAMRDTDSDMPFLIRSLRQLGT